uniref:hypothetical protein n=1 Tax=Flavobacterium sp. TaxID=239 RepID=UPI004049900F
MKKLLLLICFFCTINTVYSQNKLKADSQFIKGISIQKVNDPNFGPVNNANFVWDFSNINLNGKQVSIEVVTILDCFNGESASDFKDSFSILNKDNFVSKGNYQVNHFEVMAKCLKWRVVVTDNNQEQSSDWFYFMFLK